MTPRRPLRRLAWLALLWLVCALPAQALQLQVVLDSLGRHRQVERVAEPDDRRDDGEVLGVPTESRDE